MIALTPEQAQAWSALSRAARLVCPCCGYDVQAIPLPYGICRILCDCCGSAIGPIGAEQ